MRNANSNHKPKRYSFPLPLVIRSDSPILITDGKAQLTHDGDIIIRLANTQSVEFEPKRPATSIEDPSKTLLQTVFEPSLPDGYIPLTTGRARSASYARARSIYEYYRRESDMSFITLVRRDGEILRKINLGSLFNSESVISKALVEFSREKPFYRSDLKAFRMPDGLKHGQVIKSCLDILTHENFLDRREVKIGNRKTDRYIRTSKKLP